MATGAGMGMTEISVAAATTTPAAAGGVGAGAVPFCGRCGEPAPSPHPVCVEGLALEPPRYCAQCRRRLIVQVMPTGYAARCSAHGEI